MRKTLSLLLSLLLVLGVLVTLTACEDDSLEDAVEDVGDELEDAAEEIGEAVEEAAERTKKAAEDLKKKIDDGSGSG